MDFLAHAPGSQPATRRFLAATVTVLVLAGGCDLGTPRSQIRGVTQSAPKLEEFDSSGNYSPYYATADLHTPRYFHEALVSASGLVFVFGGSDERGLAGLDTVEIFDQSTFSRDSAPPASGAGLWIDTNFEGDPIVLPSGARMFFSVNEFSDNTMILIGGTDNLLAGATNTKVEVFDPATRDFETLETELLTPRFRHKSLFVSSGDLLIVGGQLQSTLTIEDPNVRPGEPGRQQQVTVFPTTREVEVFSRRDLEFKLLQTINGDQSFLQTQRGRAGHEMTRLAGPDNRLNTSDDIYIVIGGYQTLSAASGQAPRNKQPGAVGRNEADGLTTVEVFDPQTNIFTLIASVKLNSARIYNAQAVNLGLFNDFTPDGVRGMGNSILITGGNNDAGAVPTTPLEDQVFVANYTPGAGPAHGVRFLEVDDSRFLSHIQNTEYPDQGGGGMNQFPQPGVQIGRCAHNVVALPRPLATVPGVPDVGTWVFSLGGVDTSGGFFNYDSPAMLAGCVFDPFFSEPAFLLFNLDPTDLENERRSEPLNFLGIIGMWMTIDGFVSQSVDDYSSTPESRWARHRGTRRVFYKAVPVAGVDGIRNTFDDRILMIGGGQAYDQSGGEPTAPSAEIFLTPGSSDLSS